jgi:predicted acylesterase/phospholipase RssA
VRAVAFSGGGEKIQFFAGWCKRRIGELGVHYDILSGVSSGALVSGFLAQYKEGESERSAADLVKVLTPIKNSDVYKSWFLVGKLAGLWEPALLNSKPLDKTIDEVFDPERVHGSGRVLRIGACDLTTGEYRLFNERSPELTKALLASASFPGFLLPVEIRDRLYTDGGAQVVTPIKAAIDAGATAVDVVVSAPKKLQPKCTKDPNAIDIVLRSLEMAAHRLTWVDVQYALMVNELVRAGKSNKRYIDITVSAPEEPLPTEILEFDPTQAIELQHLGYLAAKQLEA